ncbi:HNH endonuclease [Bryobacterales bacterium F-183]|nr:HNH endonuclease [Bryobacterales bacterium F-183]
MATKSRSRQARAARRRKKRMDAVEHDLTPQHWKAIQDAWGGGCAYCGETGKPLQRDCVLAISRGGRYTIDNVVPACLKCNTSKCNEEVTTWLRRTRRNERDFLLRYFEIRQSLTANFPAPTTAQPQSPVAHFLRDGTN